MNKTLYIILNFLPVLLMIALIIVIRNDYLLALAYIAIIAILLTVRREPADVLALVLGLLALTLSETFFVKTGAEVFTRRSLFGIMPIWLPILWSYSFVAIKRAVKIL